MVDAAPTGNLTMRDIITGPDALVLAELGEFLRRLDVAAEALLDGRDRHGCSDLPGMLPWMGPRYGFHGRKEPLSVFRGEGMVLFLLARMLQPAVIAECYTGTGYAAACLAAGASEAKVFSVDNYTEGGAGDEGFQTAQALRDMIGLTNLELVRGSAGDLDIRMNGGSADLYLSDGPYGGAPRLAPHAVVVRHDTRDGQVPDRTFLVSGGSNLSAMCPSPDERDRLMRAIGQVVLVGLP